MKKILLLSIGILFLSQANAQAVGINTPYINHSAVLEIRSTNKGVLIPKIHLSSVFDDTTITNPAEALLIYNTNDNLPDKSGFYFNRGTYNSPLWVNLKSNEFKLPYNDSVNSAFNALEIKNTGTGNALSVNGKIQIYNTQEPVGRSLMTTSWPVGEVKWVGGCAFAATDIGTSDYTIQTDTDTKVPLRIKQYDLGSDFFVAGNLFFGSSFIVPANGIYHFDATIMWNGFSGGSNYDFGALTLLVNDIPTFGVRQYAGAAQFSNQISTDIKLNAGDKVNLTAYQNSGVPQTISKLIGATRFSGRFVSTAN